MKARIGYTNVLIGLQIERPGSRCTYPRFPEGALTGRDCFGELCGTGKSVPVKCYARKWLDFRVPREIVSRWSTIRKLCRNGVRGDESASNPRRDLASYMRTSGPK
jgi:hypothetical protein